MKDKTIVHLCPDEEIASDSKPYRDAGYNVILVGKSIGVENYTPNYPVHGIIANPPCTIFAGSGARWWKGKGEKALVEGLKPVIHCLRIIALAKPVFWILENPVGRLKDFLGKPVFYYQPYEYGDDYSKKTCLWGDFNIPKKNPVLPTNKDKIWKISPGKERSKLRSICSPKFAQAFKEANP